MGSKIQVVRRNTLKEREREREREETVNESELADVRTKHTLSLTDTRVFFSPSQSKCVCYAKPDALLLL